MRDGEGVWEGMIVAEANDPLDLETAVRASGLFTCTPGKWAGPTVTIDFPVELKERARALNINLYAEPPKQKLSKY